MYTPRWLTDFVLLACPWQLMDVTWNLILITSQYFSNLAQTNAHQQQHCKMQKKFNIRLNRALWCAEGGGGGVLGPLPQSVVILENYLKSLRRSRLFVSQDKARRGDAMRGAATKTRKNAKNFIIIK